MTFPTYFEALDSRRLLEDYPVGDAFVSRYTAMSRDELRARQARVLSNEQQNDLILKNIKD